MSHEAFFEFFWKADSIDRCKTFKAFERPPFFLTKIMEWLQILNHSMNVLFPVNVPMLSCMVSLENNLLIEETLNVFSNSKHLTVSVYSVWCKVTTSIPTVLFILHIQVFTMEVLWNVFPFSTSNIQCTFLTRWCICYSRATDKHVLQLTPFISDLIYRHMIHNSTHTSVT